MPFTFSASCHGGDFVTSEPHRDCPRSPTWKPPSSLSLYIYHTTAAANAQFYFRLGPPAGSFLL